MNKDELNDLSSSDIENGKRYLDEFLAHGDWEEHKYIAKVRRPNGKYRYFYDMEEYKNYLRKNQLNSPFENTFSFLGDAGNAIGDFFFELFGLGSEIVEDAMELVSNFVAKPVSSFVQNTIDNGKRFVDSLTGNLTDKDTRKHKYIAKVVTDRGYTRYFYSFEEYERYRKRQKYQASEPDFMKDVPEYDGVMSMEANAAEVNPNFPYGEAFNMNSDDNSNLQALIQKMEDLGYDYTDEESYRAFISKYYPYSVNCSLCTLTYELRERGYDVEAKPNGTSVDGRYFSQGYNTDNNWIYTVYKDAQSKSYGGSDFIDGENSSNKYDIVNDISNEPAGSRGEIAVYWTGGGGHSVAYTVGENNEVTVRDTQSNDTYTLNDLIERSDYIRYTRTDNLELTEECLEYVTDNVD